VSLSDPEIDFGDPDEIALAAHLDTNSTLVPRRCAPKAGRNDSCLCGSGKKYKRCCGGAAIH
jgi:hypothetical protein